MFVRSREEVETVLALAGEGHPDTAVASRTGNSTKHCQRLASRTCSKGGPGSGTPLPGLLSRKHRTPAVEYAYLIGLYLGDGYIARSLRTYRLRFFLDAAYPRIVERCCRALEAIRPSQRAWKWRSKASRCHVVAMYSNHWPCFFPQYGPGRKHQRPIVLADWQANIVRSHHEDFLRGLIHSDGCRVVADDRGVKSVRYHFSNRSEDIKALSARASTQSGCAGPARVTSRSPSIASPPWLSLSSSSDRSGRPCNQRVARSVGVLSPRWPTRS